jgi:branched-chain amino acid aminotransferase
VLHPADRALRGYGEIGVSPKGSPIEVYIANFPWGKYIAGHGGADVCISSWNRLAPNTMPALAKAGANYMNSQLIHMEAEINGYAGGDRAGRERAGERGIGRERFCRAQRRAVHAAAGQLGAVGALRATAC